MRWTGIPAVPETSAAMAQFLQAVKNNLEAVKTEVETPASTTTTTTTSVATSGFPSVTDYGAVGDGVTNCDAAFAAAEASAFEEIYIPTGTFLCASRTQSQFNKGYYGPGIILLGDGTAMPGNFTYLNAPPAVWPVQGTTGYFRSQSVMARGEWHVIGPGARTTSPTRYFDLPFQIRSAWLDVYDGSSGFEGQSGVLRTNSTQDYIRVRNFGAAGDVYGSLVRMEQRYQPPASQTHFFSTATVGQYGGDVSFVNTSGTYATGWESAYSDNGNDVAVIAQVDSFIRDNDTGARSCVWLGTFFKSEGAKPADAAHVVAGKWRVALDTTKADLSTHTAVNDLANVAINTAKGHRWVMNSVASINGRGGSNVWGTFFGNQLGDMFIESGSDVSGDYISMRFNRVAGQDGRIRLRPNAFQCNVQVSFGQGLSVAQSISLGATGQLVFGAGSGNYLQFTGSQFILVKGGVTVATW